MKKVLAYLLIFVMLFGTCQSVGAYTVGICTYDFPLHNSIYSANVEYNNEEVNMLADSEIEYGLTVPFNALSMDIEYTSKDDFVLQVFVDGLNYDVPITSAENMVKVTFRSNVGYDDHIFKIKASKPIIISKISLNKEDITLNSRLSIRPPVDYTDDEIALEDAIVFSESSNIIIVNNARRYIDYNDVTVKPQYFGGKLYLPLHALARAFGAYVEESVENNYYFLRDIDGTVEFCYRNGRLQKKTNGISEVHENVSILKDNAFWVSVRYFAEELGENVDYKDGIVVIDHKFSSRDIISNNKLMKALKDEFNSDVKISNSKEYHVSKNGNASDFNDGSYLRPFATIEKACKVAKPGDTVIVHEGVWREIVRPQNDGTALNPITIKAADGEKVVLSANEQITKFSTYGDNGMLIASINTDLGKGRNMLFYKGEALVEARYPNYDDLPMYPDSEHYNSLELSPLWPTQGNIKVLPATGGSNLRRSSATAVSDTLLTEPDDYWKGAVLVSAHGYNWTWSTAEIASSTKGKLELHNTTKNFYYANENVNDCAYITCTAKAIDVPGEWYAENHKLYILPPEGESADTLKLEIKQRQIVADLSNKEHIILKGFETIGGSIKLNDAKMCILNGMDMRYISHFTQFQDKDGYIDSGDLSKPGAPQRGEIGVYISGRDNAVINSKLNYSAGAGLYITGRYSYIENNYINECGYMGLYAAGIGIYPESWQSVTYPRGGHTIVSNTIRATGRGSISFSSIESWELNDKTSTTWVASEIAYNDLSEAMLCTKDGGMVYAYMGTMGNDKIKSKWHHNILYNPASADFELTMGLYADNCTEMLEIFNNIGFYEDPTYHYNNNSSVFLQFDAYVQAYNNKTLNYFPEGKAGLSLEHYPNYQVFTPGCNDMKTNLMANYELFDAPRAGSVIFAKDCEISEGAFVNSDKVYFTGEDQWIKFENVKLPENGRIKVNYSGQLWQDGNEYDAIEFVVGDDINTGKVVVREGAGEIKPDGNKWYRYYPISTNDPDTPVTLYLKVTEYASLSVESIEVEELSIEDEFAAKVYGGYYKEATPGNPNDATGAFDASSYTDTDNYTVAKTWPGTVVHYEDVKLTDDGVKFVFNSATKDPYRGRFEVRLNSLDSEPILTTMIVGPNWNSYASKIVDLNEPVKAGTYDVYLTFIDENASCNFAWFGFLKEGYNTISKAFKDTHLTSEKISGGEFDKSLSTETAVSEIDFDISGTTTPMLSVVNGDEVVCYKDVVINKSSKKLDISWASDANKKGTIKICIDDPKNEPIGTLALDGATMGSFKTSTVNLAKSIDEGTHDVYLVFEGTAKFNADVYWFAFSN